MGQDKAGSVRFLLGEAEAALGEREAAVATLERFVHEQPNVPQAATAKRLMDQLRTIEHPKPETVITHASATAGAPDRIETPSASDVTMPPIAPAIETNWAPPDVDEEKLSMDAGASCIVQEVTEAAGARVEELVKNVDQFTATEEMEHETVSPLGVRLSRDMRSFNYLVAIRKIGAQGLDVQEYRDGSVSTQLFPAHIATLGLPILVLVFHSDFRNEYEFKCEGRGVWRGRPAWVVHFQQKDSEMREMRVYRVNGMSFSVHLKGRAWIDAENSQILAMEADMMRGVPEIRLLRDHQMIEYGPLEFQKAKTEMWLPSHFLLFSVEDTQKIGTPKETQQKQH